MLRWPWRRHPSHAHLPAGLLFQVYGEILSRSVGQATIRSHAVWIAFSLPDLIFPRFSKHILPSIIWPHHSIASLVATIWPQRWQRMGVELHVHLGALRQQGNPQGNPQNPQGVIAWALPLTLSSHGTGGSMSSPPVRSSANDANFKKSVSTAETGFVFWSKGPSNIF